MYHGGPKAKHHHHHEETAGAARAGARPRARGERRVARTRGTGGIKEPNSGGNVVYLSPGIRYSLDRWSAFASVGLPIVNEVNGVQADPTGGS